MHSALSDFIGCVICGTVVCLSPCVAQAGSQFQYDSLAPQENEGSDLNEEMVGGVFGNPFSSSFNNSLSAPRNGVINDATKKVVSGVFGYPLSSSRNNSFSTPNNGVINSTTKKMVSGVFGYPFSTPRNDTINDSIKETDRNVVPPPDSRVLKAARKAQQTFELYRQRRLPRLQPSQEPPCDERVGRFCYWHREGDSLVPEPSAITRERERLITTFDRLISLSPRDDWIIGQRIRYLIEAGYDSSAVLAAWECQGTTWWCQALRGLALHTMRRYEDAEAVFDTMLSTMPAPDACKWNDVALLLSDDDRSAYTRIPCSDRTEFERRFWLLADPSFVIAGNDRRTEHFSRLVYATILRSSANAYGMTWDDDMHELLVRYGMPQWYTTTWPSTYSLGPPPITGHEREPCFHFVPIYAGSDSTRWEIHAPRARERYSPPYIDTFSEIPAQFAMFKRGDSALVVAVYADSGEGPAIIGVANPRRPDVSSDSMELSTDTTTGSITTDSTSAPQTELQNVRVQWARAPWQGISVGIERFDADRRHIAQHRSWLTPPARGPDAPQLSTLLLFTGTDSTESTSLSEAVRHALTSDVLRGKRTLGVYWEMYAPGSEGSADVLPVSITITRIDSDFRRWLAQMLKLTPRDMPIGVGWHEVPGTSDVLYRSITLDLSELQRGTYQIEVAVGEAPRQSASARVIRLR